MNKTYCNQCSLLNDSLVYPEGVGGNYHMTRSGMLRVISLRGINQGFYARFSMVSKSFRTHKAVAKYQALWLESCFIHIFLVWSDSLHTRSFRRIHLSVFRYRLSKNGFASPKSFRGFRETGTTIFSYQNIFLRELKEIRLSTKRLIENWRWKLLVSFIPLARL